MLAVTNHHPDLHIPVNGSYEGLLHDFPSPYDEGDNSSALSGHF